jgi:hypothetical protein
LFQSKFPISFQSGIEADDIFGNDNGGSRKVVKLPYFRVTLFFNIATSASHPSNSFSHSVATMSTPNRIACRSTQASSYLTPNRNPTSSSKKRKYTVYNKQQLTTSPNKRSQAPIPRTPKHKVNTPTSITIYTTPSSIIEVYKPSKWKTICRRLHKKLLPHEHIWRHYQASKHPCVMYEVDRMKFKYSFVGP